MPEKSKEQGPIAKKDTDRGSQSLDSECEETLSDKNCDYVITRNRQIELNGITFMHQIHGRKIFKYESTCLQYMRIFKEQAREEDKEQKNASREKRRKAKKAKEVSIETVGAEPE